MTKRPDVLEGKTFRRKTPCGNAYITINEKEIFCRLGKSGVCGHAFLEAMGRIISLAWREGVGIDKIAKTLTGIQCSGNSDVETSCPNMIGKILSEMLEGEKK